MTEIFALKREDGQVFKIGDYFTYKNAWTPIVNGRKSKRRMKIYGFEKHDNGYYVLYMPQYSNGVIEKESPWRACDLKSAIKTNK